MPLTPGIISRFPFYLDSRRQFFERSWEDGAFGEGSVVMLLAPRIFGKTSFMNMLPYFLGRKDDDRAVHIYSCMDPTQLDEASRVVKRMLRGGEDEILVLDEMNYAIGRRSLWRGITELAQSISHLKGKRQTLLLTTSETSSTTVREAFDVLHPGILRLPALNKTQTKTVSLGVLRSVTGETAIPSRMLDAIWETSSGIPPYVRISILQSLRRVGEGVVDMDLLRDCMFEFFENLDAVQSCTETLMHCPIETARMSERDLVLMADQFCLLCPIDCRRPSVENPVIETALARKYGLVLDHDAIAAPIAFYFNDYLGRKRFEEFSSTITDREEEIRDYARAYGRKEFIDEILILLEIALHDPSVLHSDADNLYRILRDKAALTFLDSLPRAGILARWKKEFDDICRTTLHGDRGIDLEVRNLRFSPVTPATNCYVQCKNWKRRIDMKEVGIFHKFEIVLRSARQVHAAILVSASKIDDAMTEEARTLTGENKSVFACWSEPELTTIISAISGRNPAHIRRAINELSETKMRPKAKGGALEYLALKTFSIFAEKATQT